MKTSPTKDRELFARIAQSDGNAFAEFFESYSVKLAVYVSRFLGSDLWAEEIVQDVFVKLWNIRETIGQMEYPAGFIYRMAANRAKDHLRHRGHELKLQYQLTQHLAASANNAQEQVDFRFSQRLFNEAIKRLPSQRAVIFRMRHEQGMGYDEIAAQLGLSRNTVRNQLNLALQNIRSYLLEHGDILGLLVLYSLKNF